MGRVKWVLDGDGTQMGGGAGTGKKIIPAAGMEIELTDGDRDGNANTRPALPRLHP